MLKNIFNALKSIVNIFEYLIDFIVDFFNDLVYMIELLTETSTKIPQYLEFFPTLIQTTIISLIAIAIIFKILGREG